MIAFIFILGFFIGIPAIIIYALWNWTVNVLFKPSSNNSQETENQEGTGQVIISSLTDKTQEQNNQTQEPLKVEIKQPKFDTEKVQSYQPSVKLFEFRPQNWTQFIGQQDAKERAKIIIKKAKRGMRSHFLVDGIKGHGKCHAKGTKILMYNGKYKKVENIRIGDKVMGINSKPKIVTKIGEGYGKLYSIIPTRQSPFIVNEEHILSLKKTGTQKVLNISVKDYLKATTTITDMYELYKHSIDFRKRKLPLDPYFLGLWLGNGSCENSLISNQDKSIITYLQQYAKKLRLNCNIRKSKGKCPSILLSLGRGKGHIYSIKAELKKLNLLNNKHIPDIYKINSRKNRLKLLAGLIDSNGHLNPPSTYEILTKYDLLAKDIEYLAGSLGFNVRKTIKKVKYKKKIRKYWRISIIGECSQIPVLLKRKKAPKRRINKDPLKLGFKIKYYGKGKYYGFQLNGDHLYMIENFIVNHNTTFVNLIAKSLNAKVIHYIGSQIDEDELINIVNKINESTEQYVMLFIDEIDTMDWKVIKILNPIIEQFEINGKKIRPFIFAGATINKHILIKNNPDTLDRIPPPHIKFARYNANEIASIVKQCKEQLYPNENISNEVIDAISKNCKFNPRTANALLDEFVVAESINKVLRSCKIIKDGLTDVDIKLLRILNEATRAMGANALAQKAGLSQKEYLREFEPFLVEYGYINRIPSRIITEKGKKLLEGIKNEKIKTH